MAERTPTPDHPFRPVLDTGDPYDSCEECLSFRHEHDGQPSEPTPAEVGAVVNARLHQTFEGAEPCETACTHVVIGFWTALGIANTISRRQNDYQQAQRQRAGYERAHG